MSFVYLLSFVVMFSFVSQLHGMRALGKSFARMSIAAVPKIRAKPTAFRAATTCARKGKSRAFHASNNTGVCSKFAKCSLVDPEKKSLATPKIIDVQFDVVEISNESKICDDCGKNIYDMIAENGLKYKGEIEDFLSYSSRMYADDLDVYAAYIKRVLALVLTRLGDQQYVHPILVATLVLSHDDAFREIYQVLSTNMHRVTNENVLVSYKVLEMLLKTSFDQQTQTFLFKDWDCNIPHGDLKKLLEKYFELIPKIISLPHQLILIKLMNGVIVLRKGLDEKTPKRKETIKLLRQDLKRYEGVYKKLYDVQH